MLKIDQDTMKASEYEGYLKGKLEILKNRPKIEDELPISVAFVLGQTSLIKELLFDLALLSGKLPQQK